MVHAASPVDRSAGLEPLKTDFELADGAAWDGGSTLYVPDVKAKTLYVFQPQAAEPTWRVRLKNAGAISGTCFQLGSLYLSDNAGASIWTMAPRGEPQRWVTFPDLARPNDLAVSIRGTVFVTITSTGEVRRISPEGQIEVAMKDLDSPNGITLSPDGRTLYVSSYKSGKVYAAPLDAQDQVGPASIFAQIEPTADGARGDGMCSDRAGNVYCTAADSVWIWNPHGELLDRLITPARPINCTFAGPDDRFLYISTMGGIYRQRMRAYGIAPQPPLSGPLAEGDANRPATKLPDGISASLNVVYGETEGRKLLLDLFQPQPASQPRPAVVVVHGGGWMKGDKTKFRALAIRLAERGYVTAAIEYRLGYEAPFPAAIHDCNAAVRFLRAHASDYGLDPNRIGAVGGSAGGHLVGLMATASDQSALQGDAGNREQSSRLRAAVVMAGPLRIATGSVADRSHDGDPPSFATEWLGHTIDQHPEVYHQADAHEAITTDDPPLLFLTGSLDQPERDHPSLEKLRSLKIATDQVIHEGAKHGHWNQAAWIDRVVDDVDRFLKQHL